MKVANTRKVNERISEYIKREQLNALIGTGLAAPVSVEQIVFEDSDDLKAHASNLQDRMKKNGINYTEDQSLIATMVMTVFDSYLGDVGQIPTIVLDEIIRNGRIFHEGEIEQNPYYKNIHLEGRKSGKFEFSKADDKRYELVMYDGPKSKFNGIMIPAVGAFDYDFYYPMLKENGSVWMSITPNEIFTMEKDIEQASGRVLTLGCGMGYFAYMAARKEEVISRCLLISIRKTMMRMAIRSGLVSAK